MTDIPETYVPARNLVFLSLAVGLAETLGARDIFIGANEIDYSGYPDCRRPFLESFQRTANLATKAGVGGDTTRIRAPLIDMTKAEIIARGAALGVDFSRTRSCYDPDGSGGARAARATPARSGARDSSTRASRTPHAVRAGGASVSGTLPISETFVSIQGEGKRTGTPSWFCRVSGCNLRCAWCDTPYASWAPEKTMRTIDDLAEEARAPAACATPCSRAASP